MPFIPATGWGLAYLAGLCLMGLVVAQRPHPEARRVALILAVHWVTLRMVNVIDHDNPLAWVMHDAGLVLALVAFGRCRLAYAVAAVFVPVMILDQVWLFWGSSFAANAAVAEAAGYISMIMTMGTAHDAHRKARLGRQPVRGQPVRRLHPLAAVEGRWPISRRSGVSGEGMGRRLGARQSAGGGS